MTNIEVLMQDGCTKAEAENHLKRGTKETIRFDGGRAVQKVHGSREKMRRLQRLLLELKRTGFNLPPFFHFSAVLQQLCTLSGIWPVSLPCAHP